MFPYPEFSVPGVEPWDVWQLFNVSNYPYYLLKVKGLRDGVCGFCTIDTKVNKVVYENESWTAMENAIAPRSDESGQEHQFVIPLKRHVTTIDDMMGYEFGDLLRLIKTLNQMYNISGGVLVLRSGDPAKNAKSMEHLHVNYHVPTGLKRVEVTIAKSEDDLAKKLPVLQVFEEMRLLEEGGCTDPFSQLSLEKRELVKGKLGKKGSG